MVAALVVVVAKTSGVVAVTSAVLVHLRHLVVDSLGAFHDKSVVPLPLAGMVVMAH